MNTKRGTSATLAHFFLARPVLSWVLILVMILCGAVALRQLPVAQYPPVSPPTVNVSAVYSGASAEVVEASVTQVLEQALKNLDHLLYFSSSSSSAGEARLRLTFAQGTDPEVAQMQVQNRVNEVSYRLPPAVRQAGLNVSAQQGSFLMVAVFYDESGVRNDSDLSDWINSQVADAISRVPGVGQIEPFGSPYAMRIWLQPEKLTAYGLMPEDVSRAIEAQNTEVPVGELGARPSRPGQQLNVSVTALSRLRTVEQFRNIVLKSSVDGAVVRLADVARVEIGSEDYTTTSRFNGKPASGLAINLAPGANAVATADAVRARIAQLQPSFPPGVKVFYPEDASRFVKRSIGEVVKTLLEAVLLVILVMLAFLRDWRATLIPAVTIPVVVLGTFAILASAGYSINTLTLFGLVLAIGLLVDDAIVVVENAARIMAERGLDAAAATRQSMEEITPALVGITMVLGAVFLPMAFFPGSVGVIYRQFSITLVSAMALSALVAIALTPVLCAQLLRSAPRNQRWKTRGDGLVVTGLNYVLSRPGRFALIYAVLIGTVFWGYQRLPDSLVPVDDQGTVMVRYTLPPGATYTRTAGLVEGIEKYFLEEEADNVAGIYTVSGFSFGGAGQNAGIAFVPLVDWELRSSEENSAQAIAARATEALSHLMDARVFATVLPPIDGLGESDGFEFWLQDGTGEGQQALAERARNLVQALNEKPEILFADSDALEPGPVLRIDIDRPKAAALGLDLDSVNSTLSTAWGSAYINDFVHQGRLKKVILQADAGARAVPEDLQRWYVRNRQGEMTPFAAFASSRWDTAPVELARFNGMPAIRISGVAAPGVSSGAALAAVEQQAEAQGEAHYAWSGLSYQEKISSGQAPMMYAVSILFIFLCLAVLYERWTIPLSVLLVIPVGLSGAVLAANLLGLAHDIYFQVGVIATIGLTAKNAILIVEFTEQARVKGEPLLTAICSSVQKRLRPILMTSLTFGAGVIPLVLASGPGSAAQRAIGTSVLGGVASATAMILFLTPLCHLLLVRCEVLVKERIEKSTRLKRYTVSGGKTSSDSLREASPEC
ncbi:multidrug efflux RND transporter permease subunit [Microbulbifer thermotolerans]|uniref:Efflux pump membrane transporter n=1 Tax=Microbulbifer thermotolerans TaxID=252514 RepID=A0A143HPM9_MICTH|nr:multidrug efflux RND transporter permease subunit [Microbulbifer thermotolerans]AMX03673.1 multidrug efflux RND transporter permease subunit [Microbulbifer thermotolerans]WKT60278.1 multidrug efflux RND transporter permease subunit [Microbulbifer thermotolerans]